MTYVPVGRGIQLPRRTKRAELATSQNGYLVTGNPLPFKLGHLRKPSRRWYLDGALSLHELQRMSRVQTKSMVTVQTAQAR